MTTQTLEFKFPVQVTLKIDSVTDEWIEGDIVLTLDGKEGTQHFKTKNNGPINFTVPIVDVDVDGTVSMNSPKEVCIDGNFEKKIIISKIKVPFHICKAF